MKAPCPHCKKPAQLTKDNPWRPFCCERCKLLDLKSWLDEDYAIPGDPVPQDTDRE